MWAARRANRPASLWRASSPKANPAPCLGALRHYRQFLDFMHEIYNLQCHFIYFFHLHHYCTMDHEPAVTARTVHGGPAASCRWPESWPQPGRQAPTPDGPAAVWAVTRRSAPLLQPVLNACGDLRSNRQVKAAIVARASSHPHSDLKPRAQQPRTCSAHAE